MQAKQHRALQSDRQVGTGKWRSRTPERVTPQADPDRTGGIARLEEGDEEVFDVLQEHRASHNREEPGGIAVWSQDERQADMTINQVPNMAVRDRDAEQKGKAKMYADARHNILT